MEGCFVANKSEFEVLDASAGAGKKNRKPLMEKRRRDRMNNSLEELKSLLIELDGDIATRTSHRVSKLEKADVLDMAVLYLKKQKFARDQFRASFRPLPLPSFLHRPIPLRPQYSLFNCHLVPSTMPVTRPVPARVVSADKSMDKANDSHSSDASVSCEDDSSNSPQQESAAESRIWRPYPNEGPKSA